MNETIDPLMRAPALACDSHFHVFGDPKRFPYRDPKLRYQPPIAPLEDYLQRARRIGIERTRLPVAWNTALAIAGAMATIGVSPPRA